MKYGWSFVIILLCTWKTHSSAEVFNDTKELTKFNEMKGHVTGIVSSIVDSIFPIIHKAAMESHLSLSCNLSLLRFSNDLKKLREWALKMFDASAKLPAGFLEGTAILFGDYDECLDIIATNERKKHLFVGKYCTVRLQVTKDLARRFVELNLTDTLIQVKKVKDDLEEYQWKFLTIHLGLCVPSLCSSEEINQLFHTLLKVYGFSIDVSCEIKTTKKATKVQIAILCVFALFGFLGIVGTAFDLIIQYTSMKMISGEFGKLLMAFSVYSNTIRLFRTKQTDTSLSPIRGCRVLSMFWVVLVHIYYWPQEFHIIKNGRLSEHLKFIRQITFETILGGTLALETFFLLSGMLFIYSTWRNVEIKNWTTLLIYHVSRMARIIPIVMLVISLFMILPLFGSGPIWNDTFKEPYNSCVNNWWTNLLFIQNFLMHEEMCLPHTWFIAALFQVFLLTSGLILLLYRWSRIGIFINVLLVIVGCFVTGILTSSYDLPSSISNFQDHVKGWLSFFNIIHFRPYTYIPSYCIGILLGYYIITKRQIKMNQWKQAVFSLMAIAGILIPIYSNHFFHSDGKRFFHVVYAALHRTIWSTSVSWMLFACITGNGGIVGRILSWKGIIPIDRLSLLIYLLHPLVLYHHTARTRTSVNLSHWQQANTFLATIVITTGCSWLFSAMIEQPLNYLSNHSHVLFRNPFKDKKRLNIQVTKRNKLASITSKFINSREHKFEETVVSKF